MKRHLIIGCILLILFSCQKEIDSEGSNMETDELTNLIEDYYSNDTTLVDYGIIRIGEYHGNEIDDNIMEMILSSISFP